MSGKLWTKVAAGILAIGLLAGCGGGTKKEASAAGGSSGEQKAASSEKITLRLAHHLAIDSVQNKTMEKWKQLLAEKTGGKVELQLLPASQLGSQREVIEGVSVGTIDLGLADHAYLSSLVPEYGLLDLPFLFQDYNHLAKVLDGPVMQQIDQKLLEKKGLRQLGWTYVGFRDVITQKPIEKFDDFKGIKVRAPEAKVYVETFKLLGSKPTPMAWGEVYTGLQTKVVEGMESAPESIQSMKFYEQAKFLTRTSHIQVSIGPVISDAKWKKLPKDVQDAMLSTAKEALTWGRAEAIKANDDAVSAMEKAGVKVFKLPEPELQKMRDAVKPFQDEYAKSIGAEKPLAEIRNAK